ncbi:MAG: hypothetical protein KC486_35360, partial [Myxococcales bacterium]|nr:hypothetical protein [Myxococcales bacterium]
MTEPYFPAKPGDTIKSSQWNELQARLRGEIYSHTHSGGEQGVKLDGDSIAADAALQVKEVRTLGLSVGTESQFVVNAAGKVAIGAADPGDDSLRVAGPVRATSLAADTVIAGHLEGLKELALDGLVAREVRAQRLAVAEAAGLKELQAVRVRADELAAGAVITPTIRGDGALTVGSA